MGGDGLSDRRWWGRGSCRETERGKEMGIYNGEKEMIEWGERKEERELCKEW